MPDDFLSNFLKGMKDDKDSQSNTIPDAEFELGGKKYFTYIDSEGGTEVHLVPVELRDGLNEYFKGRDGKPLNFRGSPFSSGYDSTIANVISLSVGEVEKRAWGIELMIKQASSIRDENGRLIDIVDFLMEVDAQHPIFKAINEALMIGLEKSDRRYFDNKFDEENFDTPVSFKLLNCPDEAKALALCRKMLGNIFDLENLELEKSGNSIIVTFNDTERREGLTRGPSEFMP